MKKDDYDKEKIEVAFACILKINSTKKLFFLFFILNKFSDSTTKDIKIE